MARRVFFSFDYDNDVRRAAQVRASWVIRKKGEEQPFLDWADWEEVKAGGDAAIAAWIDSQLAGSSVTAVLIGSSTYYSRWVRHEIKRSYELGKGIIGIRIHNVRDPQLGVSSYGLNPLDYWTVEKDGHKVSFSEIYRTYDWVVDDGYENVESWIEAAAPVQRR